MAACKCEYDETSVNKSDERLRRATVQLPRLTGPCLVR